MFNRKDIQAISRCLVRIRNDRGTREIQNLSFIDSKAIS